MIGLVLVGHSADVVRGVRAMVRQVAPHLPVEVAGGLSGDRLGTSAPDVAAALRRALARADAVVVLLDLGSAALALDIALEELGDDRPRVHPADAPFLEGAVLAAIAAADGRDAAGVVAAALAATTTRKLLGDRP